MMVVMALAGLIVGCADKPTYEVDFDQSFPAQYKTCCIPSECSSRARRLLTVGCERFKCLLAREILPVSTMVLISLMSERSIPGFSVLFLKLDKS